ncbi:MAG: hypothetical protein IIC55_03005 [Proteobacteria bacterium]|nr:hypothetical protein [Pseudomonadota bacterium]
MSETPKGQDEELTEEEIERRRDEIARRMLNTPPKPHKQKDNKLNEPSEKSRN